MKYCVRFGTTSEIERSEYNSDEIFIQNAINAGFTVEQVEILTQAEYDERKALEPQPEPQPSEIEILSNYVLDVDMRLIMVELGM